MSDTPAKSDPWQQLQRLTTARVGIGRVGASAPTSALLDFKMDHALARDAIFAQLDVPMLQENLRREGFQTLLATSCAADRSSYLRRPDLGRRLSEESHAVLPRGSDGAEGVLSVVVADGLSASAPNTHALSLLVELRPYLKEWTLDSVILATQARVALGDAIGKLRGAEAVLVLLGERPGLRSTQSLGAYLTYKPQPGRMDSERNCVSNIHALGLSYAEAAFQLSSLLQQARVMGTTGVMLKEATMPPCCNGSNPSDSAL